MKALDRIDTEEVAVVDTPPGNERLLVKAIERADVVVVRFGEQYRQWNAAFDAGYAAALGKPLITLHPPEHDHALKEVDRAALAVAREPEQVVDLLRYVVEGTLAVQEPAR